MHKAICESKISVRKSKIYLDLIDGIILQDSLHMREIGRNEMSACRSLKN